ncbi:MAG TPA: hypothetical protein VIU14_08555 [Mesorhizobium sp.]
MRSCLTVVAATLLMGTLAQASSVVTVAAPAMAQSPSILVLEDLRIRAAAETEPSVAGIADQTPSPVIEPTFPRMETMSPSIVAVIAPALPAENTVVATAGPRTSDPWALPVVMRGGIAGDAYGGPQPEIELGATLERMKASEPMATRGSATHRQSKHSAAASGRAAPARQAIAPAPPPPAAPLVQPQ